MGVLHLSSSSGSASSANAVCRNTTILSLLPSSLTNLRAHTSRVTSSEFHSRLRTYRNAHPIHSALRPGQRPSNTPENESLTSGNGSGGRPRPARPLPASGFPSRGIAAHRPPLFLACARRVPAWARQSHVPVSASLWPQSSARSRTSQKSQRRCRLLRQTLLDQRI